MISALFLSFCFQSILAGFIEMLGFIQIVILDTIGSAVGQNVRVLFFNFSGDLSNELIFTLVYFKPVNNFC